MKKFQAICLIASSLGLAQVLWIGWGLRQAGWSIELVRALPATSATAEQSVFMAWQASWGSGDLEPVRQLLLKRRKLLQAGQVEEAVRVQADLVRLLSDRYPIPSVTTFWLAVLLGCAGLGGLSLSYLSGRGLAELRAREYLTDLVGNLGHLALAVAPNGQILATNRHLCEALGYQDQSELVGQSVELLVSHSEDLLGHGSRRDVETTLLTRAGALVPVLLNCSVVTSREGRVDAHILTATDRSETLRTQGRLDALMTVPHLGVALLDEDGCVSESNPRLTELLGAARGDRLVKMMKPESAQVWRELLAETLAGLRDTLQFETRMDVDDSPRWVNLLGVRRGGELLCLVQDVTDRRRAEEQLQVALDRLAEVREQERRAVARDLHDGLLQSLVGVELQLHVFRKSSDCQDEAFLEAQSIVRACIDEAARLIRHLRPALLDHLGLEGALRQLLEDTARTGGFAWSLQCEPGPGLATSLEDAFFRITQESLTNVVKHARASQVEVSLQSATPGWTLQIQDDGCGFDPGSQTAGRGLSGMRERIEMLGGQLTLESAPGKGTRVLVRFQARHEGGS